MQFQSFYVSLSCEIKSAINRRFHIEKREMNEIDYHQVIKWVIIVIVAGFLGQFGKSFAKYLIERARRKKARAASEKLEASVNPPTEPAPKEAAVETTEAIGKAEKKAAKAMVKLLKKRK